MGVRVASLSYEIFGDSQLRNSGAQEASTLKRGLDIVGSLSALLLTAPLLIGVALLIWSFNRGPILYTQERLGKGGRVFKCLKFRTMIMGADEALASVLTNDSVALAEWQAMYKIKRDPRITKFGKFLRSSSIDELPQLLNVLKGDMSLVGPRPIVIAESSKYGRYFRNYAMVKPGLTGLWQVSGRNNTTYRRRVALDVAYSRHSSFSLDLWILIMTVPAVIGADGCY